MGSLVCDRCGDVPVYWTGPEGHLCVRCMNVEVFGNPVGLSHPGAMMNQPKERHDEPSGDSRRAHQ